MLFSIRKKNTKNVLIIRLKKYNCSMIMIAKLTRIMREKKQRKIQSNVEVK